MYFDYRKWNCGSSPLMAPNIHLLFPFGQRWYKSCSQSLQHQATVPVAEWPNYFQPMVVVNVSSWCCSCCQCMCSADNGDGLKQESQTKHSTDWLQTAFKCNFILGWEMCVLLMGVVLNRCLYRPRGHKLCTTCGITEVRGLSGIICEQVELRKN